MDPDIESRKRLLLLDYSKCILFQQDNSQQKLVTLADDGLKTILNAREVRLKLRNDNLRSATDHLTDVSTVRLSVPLGCHNGCRASYTSAYKLDRLRAADVTLDNIQSTSSASTTQARNILVRSKGILMNWNVCVFCQQESKKKVHFI